MNKNAYLIKPEVKQFTEFFADKICGKFEHRYFIRQTGKNWACTNIRDAALQYQWPWRGSGNTLCDNARVLDRLQINLRNAYKNRKSKALVQASIDVFNWGGVVNGNKNSVLEHAAHLNHAFKETISELNLNGDDQLLGKVWNMNAGFSKVYSLLSDGMIMYDSRVGAALGFLVKQCATQHNWKTIPSELQFPYAPPRNSLTAVNPLNRDPGLYQSFGFLKFSGRAYLQSLFMLRASWIIEEVTSNVNCIEEKDLKCGQIKIPKHRFIEAGLFMIGYDLPAKLQTKKQLLKKIGKSKVAKYQYQTLCKESEFNADLSEGNSSLLISKSNGQTTEIKIDAIIGALLSLISLWGTVDFFPLDNSATKVRTGSGKNGLGTALFNVIGKTFNPPDASSLAALLYRLDILEWDKNSKFSTFRIHIMPTKNFLVQSLQDEFKGKID